MKYMFMNSGNSKTPDPHRLLINLSDNLSFNRNDKYVALSNLSIYYTWKYLKKSHQNNKFKFKISPPTWNKGFELSDESYYLSDSKLFWVYHQKNDTTVADNSSLMIYLNKIENRIMCKIKTGYYPELLMP